MKKFKILSILLTLLALAFGADLSMAITPDTPPTDNVQSQTPDPDTKGLHTDQTGAPATEHAITESPINRIPVEKSIVKFRPFLFTFTTDIETIPIQREVTDYKIKHGVMATPIMDCTLKKATVQTTAGYVVFEIGANKELSSTDQRMFGRSQTVIVKGVSGYSHDQQNTPAGDLELKVIYRSTSEIRLIPVNGIYASGDYQVPAIPINTKLIIMATAGHTAQLKVSPKNSTPVLVEAILQRKLMNTIIEDEWVEKTKDLDYFTEDIKDNALAVFRQENERTKLLGIPGVLVEHDETLGDVNCYYEEGAIWQLLMKYCTSGTLTYKDLVSMQRMQFGMWSMSNVAEAYCSFGFIEQLLNLDFTKVAQTNILAEQTTFGVNITKFKTSFGTFNFKMCPALDDLGYEDCCMIVDMKNAVHYWKMPNSGKKSTDNLSKDSQEPLEAKRDRHVKIDCLCLRGYNSILVGPANIIYGIQTVNDNTKVYDFHASVTYSGTTKYFTMDSTAEGNGGTSSTPKYFINHGIANYGEYPTALVDGLLIYLYDPALTFNAGDLIQYDASANNGNGAWKKYSGALTA